MLTAALLVVAGCSSPPSDADSQAAGADLERIADRARRQADDPGETLFSVPSSLPGVETWTAYLGSGITVIGTDRNGSRQAIVSWVLDGDQIAAVSCSTAGTSVEACSAVADAVKQDMQTTPSGITTAAIHPLDLPVGSAEDCQAGLGQSVKDASQALADQGKSFTGGTTVIMCNSTDTANAKTAPGQCWLSAKTSDGSPHGWKVSGTDFNLAKTCCGVFYPAKSTQALVQGSSILICPH